MMTAFALVAVGLVSFGCTPADDGNESAGEETAVEEAVAPEPEAYSITFTPALTADNDPVGDLTQVSADEPMVYLYVKWRNLEPQRQYEVIYTVFDGAGDPVTSQRAFMTPARPRWATWYGHEFNTTGAARRPGTWTFEITLDGVSRGRNRLLVVADEQPGK